MTDAEYHAILDPILIRFPDLTAFGFGVWGSHKTKVMPQAKFEHDRQALMDARDQFELALDFIDAWGFRRSINKTGTTYKMKHVAEAYYRHYTGRNVYISNGAMIAALAFRGAKLHRDGPNAWTNLRSRRKLKSGGWR